MERSDTDPGTRRRALDAVIDEALETGRVVGAVVVVREHGALDYERAAGYRDREVGLPMVLDTTFRWASLTKSLVSATALALVERHRLTLEDPVTEFLPWFTPRLPDGTSPPITLRLSRRMEGSCCPCPLRALAR